jgi:septal ring factor EnvC (AmiA/AmiB activator)
MSKKVLIVTLLCTYLLVQPTDRSAAAIDTDIRSKLGASRDALIEQLREIQRNYDDVSRQIDELRRKQALLDSYRRETESAVSEVEKAMAQTR